jgi:Beta-lactamase
MRSTRLVSIAVLWLACVVSTTARQAGRPASAYAPQGTPTELGLAGYAKVLCSAVFVSGRDPDEAFRNSGFFMMPEGERDGITYAVDRERQLVRMTRGTITRTAKFYGDQGCIIHPKNHDGIFFKPVSVATSLPDPSSQPWPMGDRLSDGPLSGEIDRARMEKAVDLAFADPEALTASFVALHKGRVVAERYMPGITKNTQLESWSMGKSVTATLFGLLVREGVYRLEDPAPVPEWRVPGDARAGCFRHQLLL